MLERWEHVCRLWYESYEREVQLVAIKVRQRGSTFISGLEKLDWK